LCAGYYTGNVYEACILGYYIDAVINFEQMMKRAVYKLVLMCCDYSWSQNMAIHWNIFDL